MRRILSHRHRLLQSVTTRLTLFHLTLFGIASLIVFALIHLSLSYTLLEMTDKYLRDEIKEEENLFNAGGIEKLRKEFINESLGKKRLTVFYALLSPQHNLLASSDLAPWKGFPLVPPSKEEGIRLRTLPRSGDPHKVRVAWKRLKGGAFLGIGKSLKSNDEILKNVRTIFGYGFLSMFALGALLGWIVSKRAMAGVERVTQTAIQIGRGDLSRRVPVGNEGKEIEELARAFNNMLDRIQLLVEDLERVTNDIAHDLRSPLTRIRGMAENALTAPPGAHDFRDVAGTIIEECDRLVGLINTMLEIAQTDSGLTRFSKVPLDLCRLVREATELFQPAAEDKGIVLQTNFPEDSLSVLGDKTALQRVLANLLDNAIKFTDSGGQIIVSVRAGGGNAILEVRDTGVGIPPGDLPHIFERFYRGDKSRSTQGNGLGLSLALAIVRAHGGTIEVTSTPGAGSVFTVNLPIS